MGDTAHLAAVKKKIVTQVKKSLVRTKCFTLDLGGASIVESICHAITQHQINSSVLTTFSGKSF